MRTMTGKNPAGIADLHRIAFIVPYFGSLPWFFKFFNKSCSCNPDIDFILITDMELPDDLADNITVVRSSLDELSKQFTDKLGFEISMALPYKLCDLRPAYGFLFSHLLEGYDFWGYCDIDLVFGKIRSLITADILNRHDVITIKKRYIAGFFTLFRNNERINSIFKKSKNYQQAFQEPQYYDFDECNWEWEALHHGKDISELNSEIDSITHVIKVAERRGEIRAYWNTMEDHPGKLVWDRGNLFRDKNEKALLCHFIFFKDLDFKYIPDWKVIPDRYYINSFYLSRYAPGSAPDLVLRSLLLTARFAKRGWNILKQYGQWARSYLFASRTVDVRDIRHPLELSGSYKHQKWVLSIFKINRCLHASIDGFQFPLLNKGSGKFVMAKCRFQQLVNVEFDFRFNENISTYTLQVTGSGLIKYTFFKMS